MQVSRFPFITRICISVNAIRNIRNFVSTTSWKDCWNIDLFEREKSVISSLLSFHGGGKKYSREYLFVPTTLGQTLNL